MRSLFSTWNTASRFISLFEIFIINSNKIFLFIFASLLTTLIITMSMVLSTTISGYNPGSLNNPVDKKNCKCDCWDGFYRGIHDKTSAGTYYKAFYFNYDSHTIIILFVFLFYSQMLKEVLVKILKLVIIDCEIFFGSKEINSMQKQKYLRYGVLINLLIAVYSNYYGIWNVINYLNDRDNRMINSQLFFSISELVPSYLYFKFLNRYDLKNGDHNLIPLHAVYPVLFISVLHIYLALGEQILWGFFTTQISNSNNLRDFFLVLNDIFGILFSIFYFIKIEKKNFKNLASRNFHYFKYWFIICMLLYFFYKIFCAF